MTTTTHSTGMSKRDWRSAHACVRGLAPVKPQSILFAGYQLNERPPGPLV